LSVIKKFRKTFYILFITFATIITPPDVLTQLILSISIISVYEILIYSVLFSKQFNLEAN
jgi:Sec-independent protein secretion pathway component TatC